MPRARLTFEIEEDGNMRAVEYKTCSDEPIPPPPPPPTQEQQQYPPDHAQDWIDSIVFGRLSDVAINDSRWANREEGEVYARENNNFLVFYWPAKGASTFDLTSLGGTVSWFDYRIASKKSSGGEHTSITTSASKPIWFNDAGGGITIFKRKDDEVVPPPSTEFLAPYTNPTEKALPKNNFYPKGKEFWVSQYSGYGRYYAQAKEAGVAGVYYHAPEKLPNYWKQYMDAGMQSIFHLRQSGSNHWWEILPKMKTAKGRKELSDKIISNINIVLSDPELNKSVFAWYGREEMITRDNTPIEEQRAYARMMQELIAKHDPKKRPLYVSERGDSMDYHKGNICVVDGIMKQTYRIKRLWYGKTKWQRLELYKDAQNMVEAQQHAEKKCPSITGLPKAVVPTLGANADPEAKADHTEKWLDTAIRYDTFVSVIPRGVTGLSVYDYTISTAAQNPTNHNAQTGKLQQKLYNKYFGLVKSSGLGRALLWGDERDDVEIKITAGPTTVTQPYRRQTITEPAVFSRNIQHGEYRYILLTNNADKHVSVTLSGIPSRLKMHEILSDKTQTVSGAVSVSIEPLGVRLYKISK